MKTTNVNVCFAVAFVTAFLLLPAGQAFADYNVTIGGPASANGTWSGASPDVWTPGGTDSKVSVADIQVRLAVKGVTINTTGGGGAESGDITVSRALSWSTNTLALTAARDININAVMTASVSSSLTMTTGTGTVKTGFAPGGGFAGRVDFFQADGSTPRGGTGFLTINSTGYTVITSLGAQGSATGIDLQGISGALAGKYALGANIDASGTAGWNSGAGFAPLGSSYPAFRGVFDGLGHTISGLYIRVVNSNWNCAGLFGCIDLDFDTNPPAPATLRNVGLVNVSVFSSGDGMSNENYTGGLAGKNSSGSIDNSYSTGVVTGSSGGNDAKNYTGGLVGKNSRGSIANSNSTGIATGSSGYKNYTGGLVGSNDDWGSIVNSYSTGTVAGSSSGGSGQNYSGGLVGNNSSSHEPGIYNSYSTATVTGSGSLDNYSGGLVGFHQIGWLVNSYSAGAVAGSSSNWNSSGGLVGLNSGMIVNSYSTGAVTGSSSNLNYTGGLVGYTPGEIHTSFWNTDVFSYCTGSGSCGTGAGKTTTQMKMLSTFTSAIWDIDDASGTGKFWRIYDGHTYPLLRSSLVPLTATANDAVKTYDGTPYSSGNGVGYSPAGVDGSKVVGIVAYSGTSQGATAIGTYAITPGGLYSEQQGYDISYIDGTLTINSAPVAVSSIVIDPETPSTLYSAMDGAGIYKSTDSGATWNPAATQPTNTHVKALVIVPGDSSKLFAATYGGGVFWSQNSGAIWTPCANTNLANLNVLSLTIDAAGTLYAGTEGGVFKSADACASWTEMNTGLPN